jgi:hypothetical protein
MEGPRCTLAYKQNAYCKEFKDKLEAFLGKRSSEVT